MHSLKAILAQCGVLRNLPHALNDLDVAESDIADIQSQIAVLITNAVVKTGKTVVEDFQPERKQRSS